MTTLALHHDRVGRACRVVPGFAAGVFAGGASGASSGYRQTATPLASPDEQTDHLLAVKTRVDLGLRLLDATSPESAGPAVLVVGASTGSECCWLADAMPDDLGGAVLGTNLTPETLLADHSPDAFGRAVGSADRLDRVQRMVALGVDDICRSGLESDRFDRVFSWQTFEHVMDLPAAFEHLARLLRPGGAAFIEYNPFFSIDGAHWPATIDIPWAHARLTPEAFADAVADLHPSPRPDAASFVERAINRATQADVLAFAERAGLEPLAHLPRVRTEDVLRLDRGIVEGVSAAYPHATPCDLTCRIVRLVLRKPAARETR